MSTALEEVPPQKRRKPRVVLTFPRPLDHCITKLAAEAGENPTHFVKHILLEALAQKGYTYREILRQYHLAMAAEAANEDA